MNKEVKREWTATLRSDDYKQAKGNLHTEVGFCCLGVLCDLHRKAHPGYTWAWSDDEGSYLYDPAGERFELPEEVLEWAGLKHSNPPTPNREFNGRVYQSLAELNDAGATFAEIADVIEADL